jgi:hypothetical protein
MNWPQAKEVVEVLAPTITAVGGIIAAFWAVLVYRSNARLRRAEWLAKLYEKFYEENESLKDIREKLDCDENASPEIKTPDEQESGFSDYLNFFEFVAVLEKSGQLTSGEIEDLFGYYLDCLERCKPVRRYIGEKGYEQLNRLLLKRAGDK